VVDRGHVPDEGQLVALKATIDDKPKHVLWVATSKQALRQASTCFARQQATAYRCSRHCLILVELAGSR
jgi:hypothetical protein